MATDLLCVTDAALLAGISRQTINVAVRGGRLTPEHIGTMPVFRRASILKFRREMLARRALRKRAGERRRKVRAAAHGRRLSGQEKRGRPSKS